MYNYDFKSEKIIYEKQNCFAEIREKELFVNVIITDKNLLIFYNTESNFVTQKSRGILITSNYELLIKLELNKIKYECDNNTYINNEEIILYDFSLNKIME